MLDPVRPLFLFQRVEVTESAPAGVHSAVHTIPPKTEPATEPDKNTVEQRLLDFSLDGDTRAFGILIEPYYTTCLKKASAIMRNEGDAEDEVQNAFCKAFDRLSQ